MLVNKLQTKLSIFLSLCILPKEEKGLKFFNPGNETFVNFLIILLMDDQSWIIHTRLCSFYHQTETEGRLEKYLLAQICLKHQPRAKHRLGLGSQSISSDNMPETVVDDAHMEESNDTEDSSEDKTVFIPMRMEQLTREHDLHFYTGLNGTAAFKTLFDLVV